MDKPGTYVGTYSFEAGTNQSNRITVSVRESLSRRVLRGAWPTLGALLVYVIIVSFVIWQWQDGYPTGVALTRRAYLFAAATLALALYLIYLAGKAASEENGLAHLIHGDDHRTSTSKVQYLLWTLGVAFALAYIGGRVLANPTGRFICEKGDETPRNCVPTENWEMYIILLGLPAATAVIAKGVLSYKILNGQVQKTESQEGAKVADIATNDNGQADLVDSQYLIFNVIAFVYFGVNFIRTGSFAAVPSLLLALTSAAAATYVLNKSLQTNKPVITSVTPSLITPGKEIRIQGQNLFPPGSDDTVIVKVGGVSTPGKRSDGDSVVANAPTGMSGENQTVTVITDAQVETEPYRVTIAGSLAVIGFVEPAPKPGQKARIGVEGLPASPNKVWVTFDSLTVPGTSEGDGDVIGANVPATLTRGGDVNVTVGVDGRWSPAKSLKLGA
jgi:IPT/TIG domain